jgi:hypothetical protein
MRTTRWLLVAFARSGLLPIGLWAWYRRWLTTRGRMASADSLIVQTSLGPVDYGTRGEGPVDPALPRRQRRPQRLVLPRAPSSSPAIRCSRRIDPAISAPRSTAGVHPSGRLTSRLPCSTGWASSGSRSSASRPAALARSSSRRDTPAASTRSCCSRRFRIGRVCRMTRPAACSVGR